MGESRRAIYYLAFFIVNAVIFIAALAMPVIIYRNAHYNMFWAASLAGIANGVVIQLVKNKYNLGLGRIGAYLWSLSSVIIAETIALVLAISLSDVRIIYGIPGIVVAFIGVYFISFIMVTWSYWTYSIYISVEGQG
ncbi:MAG TPA: hypothetical protein VMF29_06435 [Candidatus Edwardsbacteria bacterium]|nr:hypothetical protein [Candidatus Edwardsbacteria bacterium]